jgi:hypothetical protein
MPVGDFIAAAVDEDRKKSEIVPDLICKKARSLIRNALFSCLRVFRAYTKRCLDKKFDKSLSDSEYCGQRGKNRERETFVTKMLKKLKL